ncbi:MAG: hypothetical protein ABIP39_09175, partial [Polyangiaceae bacterium]
MFLSLRKHLIIKIGALMLMMVAAGFFASATLNAHAQGQSIERQQARAASLFAQGLGAGVRSSMLTGDPLATQQLLAQSREGLQMKGVDRVRIFAANGDEVFSPRPPPPDPASLPPLLREALTTKKAAGIFAPIAHEERCTRCHDAAGGVRGVLELSTDGALHPAHNDPEARAVVDTAVRAGFVQLMTARRAKSIDEYFVELRAKTPALANVVVYDAYGTLAFGTEEVAGAPAASTQEIVDAVAKNTPRTIVPAKGTGEATLDIIPLPNDKRCQACHDGGETMRGALVVTTRTPARSLGPSLAAMSDATVSNIMVSGLGRLMTGYLDAVAQTGAVGTLRLYD